ncbi:MAG: carboxypeptidase-like regulatory domain-containing protein, partial [Candidatus Kariarchaeaceae archaeon]
ILDIFLCKYEESGNFIWAKVAGSSGEDQGRGIVITDQGICYNAGWIGGTADFDSFMLSSSGIYLSSLEPSDGSISGLTLSDGNPIGVEIKLIRTTDGNEYTTQSLANSGNFSFDNLSPGDYRVIFEENGYVTQRSKILEISSSIKSHIVNIDIVEESHLYDSNPMSIFAINWSRISSLYQETNEDNLLGDNILDVDQMMAALNKIIALSTVQGKILCRRCRSIQERGRTSILDGLDGSKCNC